jgi:hypothetical protein
MWGYIPFSSIYWEIGLRMHHWHKLPPPLAQPNAKYHLKFCKWMDMMWYNINAMATAKKYKK